MVEKQRSTGKPYFGGVATDIEVKDLMDHFGTPQPGMVLSHEDIEACIGVDRLKPRYRTVLERYRQRMMELHGTQLAALRGIGYRVLNANERVERNIHDAGLGLRKVRIAAERLQSVPRVGLDAETAKRADTAQVMLAKLYQTYSDAQPSIQAPGKAESSPRISLVRIEKKENSA